MPELPHGTVTFLFTDIEGSTALWERDRQAMAQAVDRHLALLRIAVEAHEGVLFKIIGDAAQAAFPVARHALAAAVEAQRALQTESWNVPPGPLRVRMALHTGEAHPRDGDYLAAPLNRLARLIAAGHGGQILLTQAVHQLARDDLPTGMILRGLGTHRLRDLQEPEAVFQVLAPGLGETFPPLRALPSHPTNLSIPPTSLLGRDGDLARVLRLFDEGMRLVTLTGPGGSGKTRLAQEIGAEALERYPDGVFFVDLGLVLTADDVVPAIASVLGVRDNSGEALLATVSRSLAQRCMLLILDNCEQVLAAAPDVGALLARCPQLALLATSREPLHLRAERTFPVAPLPLPNVQRLPNLAALAQVPSVALFVERAQDADPVFALTETNGTAVAAICRRLDGLPLAIELAAARVRLLPPEALLTRLERSLPLLTSGARDAPARQRTLRDTIAWSYDLLPANDQMLLRRLSVFVGGWTLEAAEAVTNPDGALDVLEGLGDLVERSLVRRVDEGGGEPRFGMLETIREFGLERLAESGEEEVTWNSHAAWFMAFAESADPHMLGPGQESWLDRIETEHANLQVALDWFERAGEPESFLRLAGALRFFWFVRGHYGEGRRWLERALARGEVTPPVVRARAMSGLGFLLIFSGDAAGVEAPLAQSLTLARAADDPWETARALLGLGIGATYQGDYDRGEAFGGEALALYRRLTETDVRARAWVGGVLNNLGVAAYARGELALASARLEEALTWEREVGFTWYAGLTLVNLGNVARDRGEPGSALAYYAEALALGTAHRDKRIIARGLESAAGLAVMRGQAERAGRLYGAAAALREEAGILVDAPSRPTWERGMAAARAALGEAAFAAALKVGRTLSPDQVSAELTALATDVEAARASETGREPAEAELSPGG